MLNLTLNFQPTHARNKKCCWNFLTMGLDVLSHITYDCGNYKNNYFMC